jgi:hypothetical protein
MSALGRIGDLPPELQIELFQCIPLKDIRPLRSVSREWCAYIDQGTWRWCWGSEEKFAELAKRFGLSRSEIAFIYRPWSVSLMRPHPCRDYLHRKQWHRAADFFGTHSRSVPVPFREYLLSSQTGNVDDYEDVEGLERVWVDRYHIVVTANLRNVVPLAIVVQKDAVVIDEADIASMILVDRRNLIRNRLCQ